MDMTTASPAAPAANDARRVLGAAMAGTAVEFYDFYIFGTAAALVFGPLFFPGHDPGVQLLQAYLTFAIAFVARPIGALAFGHFGDRIGRKSTLVASLAIMGLSTVLIAFLPSYAQAGGMAPLLLCILRFGQGFGLGGEWGGAALLAVENAPPGKRARYGMFPQLGAPIGYIASNGLFLLLSLGLDEAQFIRWGWRIPFLASLILVGIGLWVRLKLTETPAFVAALKTSVPPKIPVAEVLRTHSRVLFGGTCAAITCFALFYLSTTFALGFATAKMGMDRTAFLSVQLGAILFLALGILLSGWLADKYSARAVLLAGCIGTVITSFSTQSLLGSGSLAATGAYLALMLLLMGFVYGPLGAWLPGLFATRVRYTGASIAFSLAGILGGALAPNIALALSERYGLVAVGYYIGCVALVSVIGLLTIPSGRDQLG
jgi:MFS family permease